MEPSRRSESATPAWLRAQPKVVLHDHLDGGVRPATLVELARRCGYAGLPHDDPEVVARAVAAAADSGSLDGYLSTFAHTVAVMQDVEGLRRVAHEAVEDLVAQNVVYAELRFAPELHTGAGLGVPEVVEAVADGLGTAADGSGTDVRLVVCAIRSQPHSAEVARAVVATGHPTVVGFDLAGPERGNPASVHRPALELALSAGLGVTVHAGEECGPAEVLDALECGAARIGHGVALAAELDERGVPRPGSVAERVLATGAVLEVCPSSNVHTGVVASLAEHPVDRLVRAGFRVTVNPDNRLVSATSCELELRRCVEEFGWGPDEVARSTRWAAGAAFCDGATRQRLLARLRDEQGAGGPTTGCG